jgi:MFS family permease
MSATETRNSAVAAAPAETALDRAIGKSWKRLMPYMFILYFVAFIDRVNVGFAKGAMSADIGMSNAAFAFGAGIFFAAYALAGIPSNLLMHRLGARTWLSATTIVWGLLSASTAFVTTENQFIALRFVLGLAEAGFYPGILLLASIFFPDKTRASAVAIFVLGVPVALTVGSPISGALLEMHGFLGFSGWFWMFVLEGLPAVVVGVFGIFYLDNSPSEARFLTPEEKQALIAQLASESRKTETASVSEALFRPRVWHLAFIYGTIQVAVYGLMFFLPSQVAELMGSTLGFKESLVAAIPWAASALGVYYVPRYADRHPEQRVSVSAACMLLAAFGLAASAFAGPALAIGALCLSAIGFLAVQPIFWTFPARLLSGSALAAGIGFCTTIGAGFSFLAPIIRVQADQMFGPRGGLVVLAVVSVFCAGLIALLKQRPADAE